MIYHASYTKIELPEISKIKYPKDFSFGFYCTLTKEEAEYLALKYTTPTVNVYKISNPSSLSIKVFEDYGDEWLDFVISCRNGNTHKYDVVIGPIADDTIYDYIEAYSSNQMNKSYFYESMKSKYSVHQISFHTIKALCSICFIESYEIH
ncbi:MAG: DUF3990 domain-containing protein [Clostridium sp.]|nr:DUF3990 domain-containing protein [Clostridium sp.]